MILIDVHLYFGQFNGKILSLMVRYQGDILINTNILKDGVFMINVNSYFEVDWSATMNNLKDMLLEKTTVVALADALYVDKKTIQNWFSCKTKPSLSTLIIFAKFLNVDLLDILITKGQHNLITRDDVLDSFHPDQSDDILDSVTEYPEYSSREDFYSTVILNEYESQITTLRHLDEFLVYLPLFDPLVLKDVFHRMQGNLNQRTYIQAQLRQLYDRIIDSPAKKYADSFCYYCLTTPSVYYIAESSVEEFNRKKLTDFKEWKNASTTQDEYDDYRRAVGIFLKRLTAYEQLSILMNNLEEGDYDYL